MSSFFLIKYSIPPINFFNHQSSQKISKPFTLKLNAHEFVYIFPSQQENRRGMEELNRHDSGQEEEVKGPWKEGYKKVKS